jgi:hypothetical protein
MPYLGASPRNINTRSVIDHQEYLGSQADTSTNSGYYTFYVNYTPGNLSVVIRGVHMASSDYTATNGTDVRISTSTITLANDDVIEIIGYGIPSSQILERSDVNITGGQAVNLTQVGASSYKVGNTEVIDSSGNLISGTLGSNISFANIADDAISGDKIHSGTISSSTLDGIKLNSSGNSITKSDGTTAVLSESGGLVTLNNGTIGSGVVFPAGIIRQVTQNSFNDQPTRGSTTFGSFSGTPSPVKHTINNCLTGSSLLIIVSLDVSASTTGASHCYFRLYDNTNATIVNSANEGIDGLFGTYLWAASSSSHLMVNHTELYTPSAFSSGSCEIEIYCKNADSHTVYLNRRASTAGSYGLLSSSITIFEIAG